jgi:transcription initiation factor TFIID subunit 13
MLFAFGDDAQPLPETVRVLDEIVTDYIIETCHAAAQNAALAHRAKIKIDDFKFAMRRDTEKLGKMTEMLAKKKQLDASKKQFDTGEVAPEWGPAAGKRGVKRALAEQSEVDGKGKKAKKTKKSKAAKSKISAADDGDDDMDED